MIKNPLEGSVNFTMLTDPYILLIAEYCLTLWNLNIASEGLFLIDFPHFRKFTFSQIIQPVHYGHSEAGHTVRA